MIVIAAAGVLVAVLLATLALRRRNAEPGSAGVVEGVGQPPVDGNSQGIDPLASITLVPLPNGRHEAVALGSDESLAALEDSGLIRRTNVATPGTVSKLLRSGVGLAGAGANLQAARQVGSGKIVELTDSSYAAVKKYGPLLDKAGDQLGVVRGSRHIEGVLRFKSSGPKALMASNAATLAMTLAISQQLGDIEEKLEEIQETLNTLVADVDNRRLAAAVAANRALESIAGEIRRRGQMTTLDMTRLADLDFEVTSAQTETEMRLENLLQGEIETLNRDRRRGELERLLGTDRLEYWLALRVQTELAQSRHDLLKLYWEQQSNPESVGDLAAETRDAIRRRQQEMANVRELLLRLSDPQATGFIDRFRFMDARSLGKKRDRLGEIMARHGAALLGPGEDAYAVIDETPEPVVLELDSRDAAPQSR